MKTLFTFSLLLYTLPAALSAQPIVSNNEFYHIGDVINMVKCDPSGVRAGAEGEAVTWDFSGIHSSGVATTAVLHDTSTVFLTSNLLLMQPDGSREHVQESSSDSYINGIDDIATHNRI